jgi:hypothetical protein
MVNVSTLCYVLENLEGKNEDVIDLEEIHELEEEFMKGFFGMIDRAPMEISPFLVNKILQSAGTE